MVGVRAAAVLIWGIIIIVVIRLEIYAVVLLRGSKRSASTG